MIQLQTTLKLGDNSGVRLVKCLKIYKYKFGTLSLIILVCIKTVKPQSKVKKGTLYKAIIIRQKYKIHRKQGNSIFFNENSVILLNKKNEFFNTRIFGPVGNELRKKNLLKILSLGSIII